MEEQKRLPAHIDLEEFAEAITRGALRALAARQATTPTQQATALVSSALVNPTIRLGIWFEIAEAGVRSPGSPGGPIGPIGPEGPVA